MDAQQPWKKKGGTTSWMAAAGALKSGELKPCLQLLHGHAYHCLPATLSCIVYFVILQYVGGWAYFRGWVYYQEITIHCSLNGPVLDRTLGISEYSCLTGDSQFIHDSCFLWTRISGRLPSSHRHHPVLPSVFLLLDAVWRHHALPHVGSGVQCSVQEVVVLLPSWMEWVLTHKSDSTVNPELRFDEIFHKRNLCLTSLSVPPIIFVVIGLTTVLDEYVVYSKNETGGMLTGNDRISL